MVEFVRETFPDLFTVSTILSLGRLALRIVVIVGLARIALGLSRRIINRIFAPKEGKNRFHQMDEKRAKTIASHVNSVAVYAIYFIAGVMLLDSLGLNTSSLLAAAGIAGLAIGFGAQNLVKDVVSGFFILFENQFQVGDYVTVAGVSGYVEHTGLRTTWIRGFGGEVEIIPNGEMRQVTNHMGPQMRVLVHIAIAHDEDVERATQVLLQGFAEARADGALADIVEGPNVLGVSELTDSGVELLLWARAATMKQFGATRELRGLAKAILDDHGIKMGYAQRRIVLDNVTDRSR